MANRRGSLPAQIEADLLDDRAPLSSLLQRCVVLGRQAGSEKLRDWARWELNGYVDAPTVPDYRHVHAALMAAITNKTTSTLALMTCCGGSGAVATKSAASSPEIVSQARPPAS